MLCETLLLNIEKGPERLEAGRLLLKQDFCLLSA